MALILAPPCHQVLQLAGSDGQRRMTLVRAMIDGTPFPTHCQDLLLGSMDEGVESLARLDHAPLLHHEPTVIPPGIGPGAVIMLLQEHLEALILGAGTRDQTQGRQ